MPIHLNEDSGGNFLTVHVSGILSEADYTRFVPQFEQFVQERGKLRVLFDMTCFHGWEAAAMWEEIKFDAQTSRRNRAVRNGRRQAMATRDDDFLQAVHENKNAILRSHRCCRGAKVVGGAIIFYE
jgi:hypothetical protein